MQLAVCLSALLLVVSCSPCQPGYWQIDPAFQLPTGQVKEIATKTFLLSDVQKSTGIFPNRSSYTLKNISVAASYNGKLRNITVFQPSDIRHTNESLNLTISYTADKNKKDYNGTGSASLPNMTLNFTTKVVVAQGKAYYELDPLSFSYNLPSLIVPGPYVPEPAAADKEVFDDLVKKDLYSEMNFIYNTTLTIWLSDIISQWTINWSYPNPYVYNSKGLDCSYDMAISQAALLGTSGMAKSSTANIAQAEPICSDVVPPNTGKAHYYTRPMLTQLLEHTIKNSPLWMPLELNQSNTPSRFFQFYVNELENIIPNAVVRYPDFTQRFSVQCKPDAPSPLVLDSQKQLLNCSIAWQCAVKHTSGELLASAVPRISYAAKVEVQSNQFKVLLKSVSLDSVQWRDAPGYPIAMKSLATQFLSSILQNYSGLLTIGHGFMQPLPGDVTAQLSQDYLTITPNQDIQITI